MAFLYLPLKILFFAFGISFFSFAWSAQAKCVLDPMNQFKALGHKVQQGHEVLSMSHRFKTYRALEKKTGDWLELSWSEDCKTVSKIRRLRSSAKQKGSVATLHNEDLFKALKNKQSLAFYLWSPRFTYSVSWMPEAQKQLKALGFEVVGAFDSEASLEVARRTLEQAEQVHSEFISKNDIKNMLNRLDVHEFRMRGLLDHYPQIVLVKNGKISKTPIQGLLKAEGLKQLVESMEWEER